jgi:phage baseplate assembly protein W
MRRIANMTMLVGNRRWVFDGQFQWDLNVREGTVESVLQNVYNILSTPLGSQLLLRSFGLNQVWIDQPGNVGQFQARTAALVSIGLWEPRARVLACDFSLDTGDVMAGIYSIYLELEIDLTTQITAALFSAPAAAPIWVLDAPFDGVTVPSVQQETLNIFTT